MSPQSPANVPHEPVNPAGREASPANLYKSLPSPPDSQGLSDVSESVTPEASGLGSPPPEATPFQHMVTHSTLLARAPALSPTFTSSSASIPVYVPSHPLQHSYPEMVPSLSQSYPQDLDYEHDLELLSPPSSRSESPFSLAALSPNEGLRALSPFGSARSASASGFSSGISSPSPLRMDLGNQSYDAISPLAAPQALSPFRDPPGSMATPSGASTVYLSLSDESSDDDFARPYAHLGASTGLQGTFGPPQPQPLAEPRFHQPAALHPSLLHGPYNTAPAPRETARLSLGTPPLFPVAPRAPSTPTASVTPTAASRTANAAVALGAGARDPAYFRPSSSAASAHQYESAVDSISGASFRTAQEGDGASSELSESDVDFVSDYAPSESDFGADSDSSWSMPAAHPRKGEPAQAPGGRTWRA
ncbi:hypothetical protein HYPSUDRAFT_1005915 [Hypholoma sublateritium FD-334 SS-4]|uniref:Uncharacterized protein n=1 Tax=Hypholoma sublateritium (strain FD-334 SS-4) TaxID=945553 RepID=A0A0D2KSY1_HYPSF|nr:hypothetical protein HYPSUDRAFT_1005915 [Hypholoma sublateritium FD-334 SS-4]